MKKLMFGLAVAGLCGAVFANVEGANIVGYNNQVITNGNQLIGFSFTDINAVDAEGNPCVDIAKVTPTGYLDNEGLQYNYGIFGEISFQIRNSSGFAEISYDWNHDYDYSDEPGDGDGWAEKGFWSVHGPGTIVKEGEVLLNPGDGIWYNCEIEDLDETQLPNSGEAVIDSQTLKILSGNQAIANPCSYAVKLAKDKITPAGYFDSETLQYNYGLFGEISFQILNTSGFAAISYDWNHDFDYSDEPGDGEGWAEEGFWSIHGPGTPITTENDVTINMGQAIWYNMEIDDVDEGTLTFPGLDEL